MVSEGIILSEEVSSSFLEFKHLLIATDFFIRVVRLVINNFIGVIFLYNFIAVWAFVFIIHFLFFDDAKSYFAPIRRKMIFALFYQK